MKSGSIKIILVLLSISALSFTLSAEKWQILFNGKDLTGWHQLGGKAEFKVEDGIIVGTTVKGTPNSFLCSDKEYGNFILEAEVNVDGNLNSGIQIRSQSIKEVQDGRVHGYQFEIDEAVGGFTGRIWDEARRRAWLDVLTDTVKVRNAYKPEEWNKLRVEANGDTIRTFVNGIKISQITDTLTKKGFIALQVHGSKESGRKARFRNIRIKEN